MLKVMLITQNVKLKSMKKLIGKVLDTDRLVILSTHRLFPFEKEIINSIFTVTEFITFAELLTDRDMEWCDKKAFDLIGGNKIYSGDLSIYYDCIKQLKNEVVYNKLKKRYGKFEGYLCADDLGISKKVWLKHKFKLFLLEYYYTCDEKRGIKIYLKQILKKCRFIRKNYYKMRNFFNSDMTDEVYVANHKDMKYVFIGNMNRIKYRLNLEWVKSKEEYERIKNKVYETSDKCQYLSTIHEKTKCIIPDKKVYDVRIIQDGYLPPNYSSLYLKFVPQNIKYYAWDELGTQIFRNQNLSVSILPFRKKLYLPDPIFGKVVKKVLVVTSGAGDWTAVKNRSDEDLMVEAIGKVAQTLPNVEFVYRCHPVWVHPEHQGMNSINRVIEYFESLGISNIKVSSNIIHEDLKNFKLSLPRQSLDADLKGTDLVLGEHSIAMIDGAFEGIPFASINFTGRRNLFCGISDLGFPHYEDVSGVVEFIKSIFFDKELQEKYKQAINNYNQMTDIESV